MKIATAMIALGLGVMFPFIIVLAVNPELITLTHVTLMAGALAAIAGGGLRGILIRNRGHL